LKLGFKIEEFGIGFGPKLIKWRRKDVNYSIRAIPLGGFVKYLGEDENNPDDPRAMNNMPWWKRLITVFAGAGTNLLFAIILMFVMLLAIGNQVVTQNIQSINTDAPLAQTQLQKGDKIVAIDHKKAETYNQLHDLIIAADGKDIILTIERSGKEMDINAKFYELEGQKKLGLTFATQRKPMGVGEAAVTSLKADWTLTKEIFKFLGQLFTGNADISQVTGPVSTLGQMSNLMVTEQATGGSLILTIGSLLWAISINLAIFNLLPIPALDGGRMIFILIEAIRRKPINRELEAKIHFGGFVVLIGLVIFLEVYRFIITRF
jgi:regulator of sigma E protease